MARGLGLSSVAKILTELRGALHLTTSREGTRIEVSLPLADGAVELSGAQILIAARSEALAASLRVGGAQLTSYATAEEAERLQRERGPFDLLVLDFDLPDTDWALYESLRALDPFLRALAVGHRGAALAEAKSYAAPAPQSIGLPCECEELLRAALQALAPGPAPDAP